MLRVDTSESDSDSGNSLFLTQSVTPVSRTVKRCRPSDTQTCLFSQLSEDEQETNPHGDVELLHRWRSPTRARGSTRRRRFRHGKLPVGTVVPPSWKKSGAARQFSSQENYTIVNSEIGGFFKCLQKLSKGRGEKSRQELFPPLLPAEWEQVNMEESDKDEDIRKVNLNCFIFGLLKRNRQTWLPFPKMEKNKKCRKEPHGSTDLRDGSGLSGNGTPGSRKRAGKSRKPSTTTSLSTCSTGSHPAPEKSPFLQSSFTNPPEKHADSQPRVLVQCSQTQSLDWRQTQKAAKARKNSKKPVDETVVEETQWPSSSDQDADGTQILENPMDQSGEKEHYLCERQLHVGDICKDVHNEPVETQDFGGGFPSSQDLFEEPNNNNNQSSPLKTTSGNNANKEGDRDKNFKSQATQTTIIGIKEEETAFDISMEHVYPSTPFKHSTAGFRDLPGISQANEMVSPLFNYGGMTFLKRKKGKRKTEAPTRADPHLSGSSAPHFDDPVEPIRSRKDKGNGLLENPVDALPKVGVPGGKGQDGSAVRTEPRKGDASDRLLKEPIDTWQEIDVCKKSVVCASGRENNSTKKHKRDGRFAEPDGRSVLSVQESSVCGSKPVKRRKLNGDLLAEPVEIMQDVRDAADPTLSAQDASRNYALADGSKPKKKRKKERNDKLTKEPVDIVQDLSVSADITLSAPDCASVSGSQPKKKRKRDKHGEPAPNNKEQPIGVQEAMQVSCQGSTSLVSVTDLTEQLSRNGFSSADRSHEVNQLDMDTQADEDLVHSDGLEPRRKKKKKKKKKTKERDSSPVKFDRKVASPCNEGFGTSLDSTLSVQDPLVDCVSTGGSKPKKKRKKDKHGEPKNGPFNGEKEGVQIPCQAEETEQLARNEFDSSEGGQLDPSSSLKPRKKKKAKELDTSPAVADGTVSSQCSKVSLTSQGTKTAKKKQKFMEDEGKGQVGELTTAGKSLEEALDKSLGAPDDSVFPRKKRKKKRKVIPEEVVDAESSSVKITEQVETPVYQQAAEVVRVKKKKKEKNKPDEEQASTDAPGSLGLVDTTPSCAFSTRSAGEEEGLAESESVKRKKKKKKKRKEL